MRTKQEIEHAVAILRKKGDQLSLVQLGIIEDCRTESWVFEHYVINVEAQNKDEVTFFAARDAARYLTGAITLDELIPDADSYRIKIKKVPQEPKVSTRILLARIETLEGFVNDLLAERRQRTTYQQKPDYNRSDFINQQKACEYVGCSKNTLKSWTDKGLITGYRKGTKVCYSKSELNENSTVQNFIHLKNI